MVCTFHVKFYICTFWRRHVCTLVVDVFIQICTFEDALFVQMWLFAHLRAKCLHKCGGLHIWGRNVCTNVVVCTFKGEMFAQMWLILDENKDLHILWDVCTFHIKIEPLHIWRRHVCTSVVDVFLQICEKLDVVVLLLYSLLFGGNLIRSSHLYPK